MNGFLNINKPAGLSSHDVVARVRRRVGRGVKVGHAGTLDPAATGVLPVALGYATRLIEYLTDARKGYRGVVRLGISTATDDAEGEVVAQRPVPPLNPALLEETLARFRGPIMQVPPLYSALHHEGRRLYELAREGKTLELAPRPLTIYALRLVSSPVPQDGEPAPSTLVLEIECSKGTYIRALARDLGEALGCGAHLAALERSFVGPFTVAQALDLSVLEHDPDAVQRLLQPAELAVADWPTITLDATQSRRVRNGMPILLADLPGEYARAHEADGTLVALLRHSGDVWKPEKVLVPGA